MPGKDWNRRDVLAMAASASTALVATTRPLAQVAVRWSVGTELPKTKAPPNAADCHHLGRRRAA